jgi:hypothetical protein
VEKKKKVGWCWCWWFGVVGLFVLENMGDFGMMEVR